MRMLVCGGRTFGGDKKGPVLEKEVEFLEGVLDGFHSATSIDVLIEGEAWGADRLARLWAEKNGVTVEPYPADWVKHGRGAGPIRNRQMLVEGKPDHVLAFVNMPLSESRGTADMVKVTRAAGVPVHVLEYAQ